MCNECVTGVFLTFPYTIDSIVVPTSLAVHVVGGV
jgi:hypothetical protein